MTNYTRIRIDKDTLIPVPTRTGGTGEGTLYVYFTNDPTEKPTEMNGEMADALRGWINGAKAYPVTENGILNVYGSIVEGLEAQRALGTVNFPLVDVKAWPGERMPKLVPDLDNKQVFIPEWGPNQTSPVPTSAVPQIDVNKIAQAIKERKG